MELRAMSGQAVADRIEARFGARGDVGLQLRGEPLTHLSFSVQGIVIVVPRTRLLRVRDSRSGQEEK